MQKTTSTAANRWTSENKFILTTNKTKRAPFVCQMYDCYKPVFSITTSHRNRSKLHSPYLISNRSLGEFTTPSRQNEEERANKCWIDIVLNLAGVLRILNIISLVTWNLRVWKYFKANRPVHILNRRVSFQKKLEKLIVYKYNMSYIIWQMMFIVDLCQQIAVSMKVMQTLKPSLMLFSFVSHFKLAISERLDLVTSFQ